jgi:hypothetical protein
MRRTSRSAPRHLEQGPNRSFSPARGLVDGHAPDTPRCEGMLVGIGPVSPRHRALCLLSCHALKERAESVVGVASLERPGFGSPSSIAAMIATFWLSRAKSGGPSSFSRIPWFTSQALAHARPPSLQRPISHSSLACSCSNWRRASSSSFCCSRSYSSRTCA